jgi:hypothetical protein
MFRSAKIIIRWFTDILIFPTERMYRLYTKNEETKKNIFTQQKEILIYSSPETHVKADKPIQKISHIHTNVFSKRISEYFMMFIMVETYSAPVIQYQKMLIY